MASHRPVGNIMGANLLNIVLVSGTAVTLSPFDLESASATSLTVDLPLMMAVMLLLVVPELISRRMNRWQGVLLLGCYAGYCLYPFIFV
ncbi:MAG TPA: hypothetical protein IAC49_03570 [Candidatus Ventricola intestinavium]|nr:hypothetical protein [Candidatus Ventricola intestinavium]